MNDEDDIFGTSDDTTNDLDFDVNTDAIRPTAKRVAPTPLTDDPHEVGIDHEVDSLEAKIGEELAGLEENDEYFEDDSWEK